MKKIVIYLSMILMIFSLVGCNQNNKPTNIKVDIGESTKFSKEEIDNAVDCLKRSFDFEACTLTKIYYNEEISNTAVEDYLQFGNGSVNKVKAENVIVLLSDFDVDNSGNNPVLNPGETYTNYNWILIRDDKNSDWKVDDCGF
ncbi:MAG: DUF4829 domain-containing protein [Romboutsia timonensis]|uniref:DUF4829 domain-containing protein n=1 Tax=Romboutsia timonensis TaxID=1776391 RepID=UPI002A75891C|nr:DUF4829 domain-containing protein [Romboutsia timonensis]MDY3000392.1 DUF4829 domain-containing protein [Romboutsia timonensis]